MKIIIYLLIFFGINSKLMSQNKHPMKIAMVSVLVEDPAKAFKYYTEVLGFEEVMFSPDEYLAVIKSPLDQEGVNILLEPTEPGGIEIAKEFKHKIYELGYPVITFSCDNIDKTVEELKSKGVLFKKDVTKMPYGHEAVFDDDNGNYIQIIQMN